MSAEVKPGFKQTEVGVLPVDWEARKLGELASFRTGPFGSALHKSDYTNDGIPVVNPMHILDGQIVPTTSMTITEDAAKKLEEFRLKPGEVIIGRRGDMGRCAVVSERESGWLCGTGSMIVRPSISMDAYFLQRVLSSPSIIKAIEDSSVGSTMINLNQGTLSNLVVQAPKIEEQRAVAATLSDMDALISSLDQLIAKKRDIRQATMQQLLTGQLRLPGFSGEWEVKRLGDIVELVMGQSPSSSNYNRHGDGLPLIQGNADIADRITIKRIFTTELTKLGKCGDILLSVRAPVGEVARAAFDVCLGRGVCAIRGGSDFLYHYLISIESSWTRLSKGSTFDSINSAELRSVELRLPPSQAEQSAIATILSDMDAELAALEARRDKARQLKQGMMQELLTGKTRLL